MIARAYLSGILRRLAPAKPAKAATAFNRQQAVAPTYLSKSLRLLYFQRLFGLVGGLPGDIVECGVGHGESLLMLHALADNEGMNRRIWGFDSFQGFPDSPETAHRGPGGQWRGPELKRVYDALLEGGVPNLQLQTRTTLVAGFFADSLPKYTGERIALLHLDVDLGESYAVCLAQLWDKVAAGGVIAFDEYMGTWEHNNFPKAQASIGQFLSDNHCSIQRDSRYGKYFAVKGQQQP